jgi:hypothetical protein
MAVGWPTKTTYANGDVYSASDVNDTNGTINLLTSSTLSRAGGKNGSINGGFDIWQRGTSFNSAASLYTADRWSLNANTAQTLTRQTVSDTTNLPTIQYCARIQRTNGSTNTSAYYFTQSWESSESYRYAGQTVTLSFYARKGANFSSTFLQSWVYYGTGTDQNINGTYTGAAGLGGQNNTLTTTWQRFTMTVSIDKSATELALFFALSPTGTAGAADYFEITGVQLELGSTATTFSRAGGTIQGELAACQRYYVRLPAFNTNTMYGNGFASSTTSAMFVIPLPVTLRTAPGALDYSNNFLINDNVGGSFATTVVANNVFGSNVIEVYANVTSGLTQYRPYRLISSSTSGYLAWSAEL